MLWSNNMRKLFDLNSLQRYANNIHQKHEFVFLFSSRFFIVLFVVGTWISFFPCSYKATTTSCATRAKKKKNLKGSGIGIANDFPKEIDEIHQKLYPVLKEAKRTGQKATIINKSS